MEPGCCTAHACTLFSPLVSVGVDAFSYIYLPSSNVLLYYIPSSFLWFGFGLVWFGWRFLPHSLSSLPLPSFSIVPWLGQGLGQATDRTHMAWPASPLPSCLCPIPHALPHHYLQTLLPICALTYPYCLLPAPSASPCMPLPPMGRGKKKKKNRGHGRGQFVLVFWWLEFADRVEGELGD